MNTPAALRFDRLDALRGAAIVWMAVFHFCFDLNHFGLWEPRQLFTRDPFWTTQRTVIVSIFLLCAGLGQAVAMHTPQNGKGASFDNRPDRRFGWGFDRRFWRRWAQVAGCALLVSAGSAVMFPNSWISFGVLHGVAVMLLLTRLAAPLRQWLWPLGALCLALPHLVQHSFFDSRATNWLGLVTSKPFTEDFVPVLPWLGVMWWGLAAGQWLLQHRRDVLAGAVPTVLRPLAVLGRWSLSFYLLHQPVLMGALTAWVALRG